MSNVKLSDDKSQTIRERARLYLQSQIHYNAHAWLVMLINRDMKRFCNLHTIDELYPRPRCCYEIN